MNRTEVISKISEKSGASEYNCEVVLNSLENVLGDELSGSKNVSSAFGKVYDLMSAIKNKEIDTAEMTAKISEKSGVNQSECAEILNGLEEIVYDKLATSKSAAYAFEKVYKVLDFIKSKRNEK